MPEAPFGVQNDPANARQTRQETFDERSARIETGAHLLKSESPRQEPFDERSARIETGAHSLNWDWRANSDFSKNVEVREKSPSESSENSVVSHLLLLRSVCCCLSLRPLSRCLVLPQG